MVRCQGSDRCGSARLKLTISALEAAGLTKFRVTFGDLGLFAGLLADTEMPERWRRRLQHHFWRPHAFRELLESFCATRASRRTSISALVDRVARMAMRWHSSRPNSTTRKLPFVGGRDVSEIAARLEGKAADRRETPLERAKADTINAYLAIAGDAASIDTELRKPSAAANAMPRRAIISRSACSRWRSWASTRAASTSRQASGATSNTTRASPSRSRPTRRTARSRLQGGGRYDNLLSDMGSPAPYPQ
jgi:ATP phosphoribosyltransferase regulatory subunit